MSQHKECGECGNTLSATDTKCGNCGHAVMEELSEIERLSAQLREGAKQMSYGEARYLVDSYYQIQEYRKSTVNQEKSIEKTEEPSSPVIKWFSKNLRGLEGQLKNGLAAYARGHEVGRWALSIYGIGPVISAGLIAHAYAKMEHHYCSKKNEKGIGCTADKPHKGCGSRRMNYVGQLWSFAGLSVGQTWESGKVRPWNAKLKVLCWKVGQSFLKFKDREDCFYGPFLNDRIKLEWDRNLSGELADQARKKLEDFKIKKDSAAFAWYNGLLPLPLVREFREKGIPFTDGAARQIPTRDEIMRIREGEEVPERFIKALDAAGYEGRKMEVPVEPCAPMLPPGHIMERACRWIAKLFLSHWHAVAYEIYFGEPAPLPWIIEHGGHKDHVPPPNWPMKS